MDPTNTTPTSNPAPSAPVPGAGPEPVSPPAAASPAGTSTVDFSSLGAPEASNAPAVPVAPASATPIAPASIAPAANPVIMPTPAPQSGPVVPTGNPTPINPVFQPSSERVAATDPIMMPEPAPAPDPVEEELKAPMKAAEPVPGSIGSAVSGPEGEAPASAGIDMNARTPSVSFTDPATQPDAKKGNTAKPKKNNKRTLIALVIVAVMVVIALGAVFAMQLLSPGGSPSGSGSGSGSGSSSANNNSSNNSSNNGSNSGSNNSSNNGSNSGTNGGSSNNGGSADVNGGANGSSTNNGGSTVASESTLSCTRNMTTDEIVLINDAISGTISISAKYSAGALSTISLVKQVVYNDENASSNEPVDLEVHEATAAELTADSAKVYYITAAADGTLNLTETALKTSYEGLEFTCNSL